MQHSLRLKEIDMASTGWGHVLAAGFKGWQDGTNIGRSIVRDRQDDAWRDEQRAAAREDAADKKTLKSDLRAASMPATVDEGAGGAILPPTMDNRDVGQPDNFQPMANVAGGQVQQEGMPAPANGGLMAANYRVGPKTFDTSAGAANFAAQQNSPEAIAGRQAQVYQARGMPSEAAALENRQADLQKKAVDLKKAGVFEGLQEFRAGNKDAALKSLKASGMFRVAPGDTTITPKVVELPGIGKIQSYDLTFNNTAADGTVSPMTINSHTASLAMMPYEKQLELQRKGTDTEAKANNLIEKLGLAQQRIDLTGQLNEARIAKMQAGGGDSGAAGKADREYRLQLQNMTGNVSREIREIDVAAAAIQKDAIPGRTDPRLADLSAQRSQLQGQRTQLNDEFVSLAQKGRPENANLAAQHKTPKVSTSQGQATQVKTRAEYDKLPSGAVYVAPNGETMRKK